MDSYLTRRTLWIHGCEMSGEERKRGIRSFAFYPQIKSMQISPENGKQIS